LAESWKASFYRLIYANLSVVKVRKTGSGNMWVITNSFSIDFVIRFWYTYDSAVINNWLTNLSEAGAKCPRHYKMSPKKRAFP